ncbi:COG2426 family protein [Dolosicoccus paucivorans]|uniref:COG2426 family protein n=1 Tax=Dolosicoccus paucivorans TaxID=84521 RepID=UPI001FD1E943|nr:small multi-drug export protein [Dolosicoccus paucivorans]
MICLVETVIEFFQHYFTPKMIVFLISMIPVLELRGGLIAASILGVPWKEAALIGIIGNAIPVPFIIYFIEYILNFLSKHGPIKGFASKMVTKGREKGAELSHKYPNSIWLGLLLFVGIPLPGTGAWTGSLIAAFLGRPPLKSMVPIGLGLVLATTIMLMITYFVPSLFGF